MDDDRDALAAEYVLGTLAADERDQAEALLEIDPGFAEIVRVWERRLGELNVMVEAVEPPPEVWDKIKAQIAGAEQQRAAKIAAVLPAFEQAVAPIAAPAEAAAPELTPEAERAEDLDEAAAVAALASSLLPPEPQPGPEKPAAPAAAGAAKIERSAEVVYLARQARRWRAFTVAMSAIAALLALYVGVGQLAPGLLPRGRPAPAPATAPPAASNLVAVLQQEPTAPAFLLTVDPQNRTMTVRRMTPAADPGRSYELWLLAGPNPRSLGLIGAGEFTSRPLPAEVDAEAVRSASYAVSLEPAGGSPKGVPTGPILFTGKMVEAVPGPPPKS